MSAANSSDFVTFVSSGGGNGAVLQGHESNAGTGQFSAPHDYTVIDKSLDAKGGNGKGKPGGDTGDGGGTPTVTDTYTSGDPNVDDSQEYNITIEFVGEWPDNLKAAFIASADYLSTVIAGDLADVTYNGELIDDVVIQASLADIDGTGGVLGQAGPTVVRTANYLPIEGIMEFDIADAQAYSDAGYFDDIVLHEMLHVLGFGTLWDYNNLVETTVDTMGTKRPIDDIIESLYVGENALGEYGDAFLFVETDGGAGTAGGHWDEETYMLELMTGYIGYEDPETGVWSGANYLSDWSLASLADIGYVLDPAFAGLDTINFA